MTTEGPDLFDAAVAAEQKRLAGSMKYPAGGDSPAWPGPWIRPFIQDDGTALGLPLEDWIEFDEWRHTKAGGEIANLFIRYSLQMLRRGWKSFAAEAIVNKIRWEQALANGPDDPDGFKINNNWKKRLAIWAMKRDSELDGFFELRDQKKGIDGSAGD